MIKTIIIIILSLLFEIILPNIYINYIPFIFVGALIIISNFNVSDRFLYITIVIYGFIYDLLFTNFIILHPLIFILIVLLSKKVLNKTNNIFYYLLLYFVIIIIYTLFIDVITTNNNLLYFYNNIKTILIINTIIYLIYYLSFIGIKCLIKNKHKNHSYL